MKILAKKTSAKSQVYPLKQFMALNNKLTDIGYGFRNQVSI